MYVYVDPEDDFGRGEVKYTHVDPFRVYVDPAARDRYFRDASGIILSTYITKEQLVNLYPELEEMVDDIEVGTNSLYGEDYPSSNLKTLNKYLLPMKQKI